VEEEEVLFCSSAISVRKNNKEKENSEKRESETD